MRNRSPQSDTPSPRASTGSTPRRSTGSAMRRKSSGAHSTATRSARTCSSRRNAGAGASRTGASSATFAPLDPVGVRAEPAPPARGAARPLPDPLARARRRTPLEESWAALAALVDEGKVRWLGVSNFDVDQLDCCERIRHVDSLQPPLSILRQGALRTTIRWAVEHRTGVVAYSPMASGLLTGTFDRARLASLPPDDVRLSKSEFREPELSRNLALVERLRGIARDLGASVAEVAVAWALAQEGVTAAIVGARRPQQIAEWLGAARLTLPAEVLSAIDEAVAETGAGSEDPPALPAGASSAARDGPVSCDLERRKKERTLLAACYVGNRTVEVLETEPRRPGAGEVELDVAYTGICGTDLHILHGAMDARVDDAGGARPRDGRPRSRRSATASTDWAVGDPSPSCRSSGAVTALRAGAGHSHICHHLNFLGIDSPGSMQSTLGRPGRRARPLPPDLSLEVGALVEPTAVAVHDVRRRASPRARRRVVVGGGPIGLLVACVARASGAEVLVLELERAASRTRRDARAERRRPDELRRRRAGRRLDGRRRRGRRVRGLRHRRRARHRDQPASAVRGRLVVVAIHATPPPVDLFRVFWRELTLIGARVYDRSDFEEAIRLLHEGPSQATR